MNRTVDLGSVMNRVGWAIALAGISVLGSLAVMGATDPTPDTVCMAGYYQSGSWCVDEQSPSQLLDPGSGQALVAFHSVGPQGFEPWTKGL